MPFLFHIIITKDIQNVLACRIIKEKEKKHI